jgi:hypothetical protein
MGMGLPEEPVPTVAAGKVVVTMATFAGGAGNHSMPQPARPKSNSSRGNLAIFLVGDFTFWCTASGVSFEAALVINQGTQAG